MDPHGLSLRVKFKSSGDHLPGNETANDGSPQPEKQTETQSRGPRPDTPPPSDKASTSQVIEEAISRLAKGVPLVGKYDTSKKTTLELGKWGLSKELIYKIVAANPHHHIRYCCSPVRPPGHTIG
ncbi:unnamed protein product [Parnassius apollo]|uniref:(apollo) hypothetical protein n=1 Tax=Parnassius apollo TaxID=110799 RepID=A0A8S3XSR6_PARAO|nr:unnamed protein product [Parnassius apollo]